MVIHFGFGRRQLFARSKDFDTVAARPRTSPTPFLIALLARLMISRSSAKAFGRQHLLYFFPLKHGHRSFLPMVDNFWLMFFVAPANAGFQRRARGRVRCNDLFAGGDFRAFSNFGEIMIG
jgi:hypothetical protein